MNNPSDGNAYRVIAGCKRCSLLFQHSLSGFNIYDNKEKCRLPLFIFNASASRYGV